ncbi:MAG TPA: hypothetical protein VMS74_10425 [Acidimicrobiia bacterium]|nr:hypothetical protein [Acidimicrobiia bacterium]
MWAAESHLRLLGTGFTVRCTSAAHADQVTSLLESFVAAPSGVPAKRRHPLIEARLRDTHAQPDQVILYRDCRRLGPAEAVDSALTRLVASLNRVAIESYAGFATHAGVVTRGDRAIALPAASGGGKSTLTTACLAAGLAYASDEALCVDPADGTVIPYPKPIALTARSLELLRVAPDAITVPVTGMDGLALPADLGADVAPDRLQLEHVVLSRFGDIGFELEEVAASEAMAALLTYSFNHYKLGETAFRLAAALATESRVWRMTYSDPRTAAQAIAELP